MAAVLPIIASFASASAAVTAAGTIGAAMSTVSGFLSIAGAALTTVGAITGKKDLVKIGGFMSLGGGIGTALNAASGAASGVEALGEASGQWASSVAPEALGNAAAGVAEVAPEALGEASKLWGNANDLASGVQPVADTAQATDPFSRLTAERAARTGEATAPSLWETTKMPTEAMPGSSGRIAAAAATMPPSELQSLLQASWDKAGQALSGVGNWAKANPELVKIGGNMLGSMYGPQAEMMDFKKSIYQRQMQNLNSPVRLTGGGQ